MLASNRPRRPQLGLPGPSQPEGPLCRCRARLGAQSGAIRLAIRSPLILLHGLRQPNSGEAMESPRRTMGTRTIDDPPPSDRRLCPYRMDFTLVQAVNGCQRRFRTTYTPFSSTRCKSFPDDCVLRITLATAKLQGIFTRFTDTRAGFTRSNRYC